MKFNFNEEIQSRLLLVLGFFFILQVVGVSYFSVKVYKGVKEAPTTCIEKKRIGSTDFVVPAHLLN